ncbi:substrate-binding protein [Varunaivibrio sulfuroxidans]|uniref:Amino acid/amide ABC transporter substrate-binding protein (HAAT family) n=1 Tax=Varunaivibrio sulfuroxidans TaxID=1773489 RepID=A0A4R3J7A2_9PROT|nr:substrate-binding protein [Varunaivibrio sulfuroxidans]TCS61282.1 amino acid/amide ABC transporter substrate-binding protein (HAAT family) [Varunaivibrio sulfuroxidans]WES31100.1 substrate-binding protein [Varunaivibrio sulfuroxidans]
MSDDKILHVSRRGLLKAGAATTLALGTPAFFMKNAWAQDALGNFPVNGPKVMFGFNVPQTGAYADEGADELRAYKLAVKHLNSGGGMLETFKPSSLKGNGVLGKKVDFVVGDTQTNPDAARTSARRMIERDKVIMWGGGSSSSVAIAQQYLAQEVGVIFMCGLTHSNDTTGKDKRRYGFRHFFNAYMTGKALAPVLAKTYGKDRRAFHLTADYSWGHTQYESMKEFTEKQGWTTVGNIMTPLKATDFSQYLTAVINSDADVLVLNHYGKNMVNSLSQAVDFGMRDMIKNGKHMEIVVPLYSRLMAQGAGASKIDGVLGTSGWNWTLQDAGSKVFTKAFEAEYGFPPSQAAQTCYCQTLLYANACEVAGTFYPPEVIKALEGFEFEGMGLSGKTLYRAADHQCFKDILVVRGKGPDKKKGEYDLLEVVEEVPRDVVTYDPKIFGGELGPYKPA